MNTTQVARWLGAIAACLIALLLLSSCGEEDYSRLRLPKLTNGATVVIDPDKSIYGIPLSTPRRAFVETYGEPTGFVTLSNSECALLYGTTHAFVFQEDALVGVCIRERVVDWKISSTMPNSQFDTLKWQLSNGITKNTSLSEAKRIVGAKLGGQLGAFNYPAGKTWVELDFIHHTHEGHGDDAYHVWGIRVIR
jgi:hypothetical protein